MQHVILDRDPLYTATFRRLVRDGGVTPLVLPAWTAPEFSQPLARVFDEFRLKFVSPKLISVSD
jgi:hypothetical protein